MRNIYRETFDQIHASEQLREEVLKMTKQEHITTVKRRIPKTALIAAALALVLAGTALAVASPTLREWFEQKWAEETGSQLTESQSLVIDSLTQKVGASDTSGEVPVTVDSITVGTSQIWALLDVEGWDFDRNAQYSFDRMRVEIVPDPSEGQHGGAGYGLDSIGFTEDGRCRMLLEFSATISTGNQLNSGDYALEIDLNDLIRYRTGGAEDEILYEGDWSFSIPLTPESMSPVITIGSAEVTVNTMEWEDNPPAQVASAAGGALEGEEVESRPATVTLTDIQITATGVAFCSENPVSMVTVTAILADGTEVMDNGGGGGVRDNGTWYASFDWPMPLDVTDIIAIRFGDTEIPLN